MGLGISKVPDLPLKDYTFGLLNRGEFRRALGMLQFKGQKFTFYESKGILNSVFTVRAPDKVHENIGNWILKVYGVKV